MSHVTIFPLAVNPPTHESYHRGVTEQPKEFLRLQERPATVMEAGGLCAPAGQEYWLRIRVYRRPDGTMLRTKRLFLKDVATVR